MQIIRTHILLLIASIISIKAKAQAILTIPAKQIRVVTAIKPIVIRPPESDSLRNRIFTYRDSRIPPPLFVINGKIVTHEAIAGIDAHHIKNIIVVKGREAISMFGTSGNNGAIIITTNNNKSIRFKKNLLK